MSDTIDPNDCKGKLQTLLSKAQDAAQQDDPNVRLEASDAMRQFIVDSTPNNDFVLSLDDIAGKAASALLQMNINDRLRDIATCNVALAKATKQFTAAAEKADETARSLRLERVSKELDALNEAVASIQQLRGDFENGLDASLLSSLKKAEDAVTALSASLQQRA